ncbi:TetR family transcriptional regulator [Corynebacterium sp. CCUG 60159]|nr:TetR family transcriptional regulator [Corynebacterium pseudogenitalium]
MKVMGRPREFDEDEVIRRAIKLFGERGYTAQSVDATLTYLEINRSSFYKIFGSKHGLLRTALEAVCRNAKTGEVTLEAKSLVAVTLVEVAPVSQELRPLILEANSLCFAGGPAALGKHLLDRASSTSKGETQ